MLNKTLVFIIAGNLIFASLATMVRGQNMTSDVKIFMCGDVMTGRGIDQVLPHPADPQIHESYLKTAKGYVQLAEALNGPIRKPVSFDYIWGDALEELNRAAPHVRLINLETSITTSDDYWKGKGIHYRMHPHNIASLTAAGIDVCALANNHVLDWGYAGLAETLASLSKADIQTSGRSAGGHQRWRPAKGDCFFIWVVQQRHPFELGGRRKPARGKPAQGFGGNFRSPDPKNGAGRQAQR
jgi:hypothetical protein